MKHAILTAILFFSSTQGLLAQADFFEAVLAGDVHALKEITSSGLRAKTSRGKNQIQHVLLRGLLIATSEGHLGAVDFLWNFRGHSDRDIFAVLLHASRHGQVDLIRFALGNSAPINAFGSRGDCALLLAVRNNQLEAVKFLLNNGASLTVLIERGQDPILMARELGFNDIAEELQNAVHLRALFQAASDNDLTRLREALNHVDHNQVSETGTNILEFAARQAISQFNRELSDIYINAARSVSHTELSEQVAPLLQNHRAVVEELRDARTDATARLCASLCRPSANRRE